MARLGGLAPFERPCVPSPHGGGRSHNGNMLPTRSRGKRGLVDSLVCAVVAQLPCSVLAISAVGAPHPRETPKVRTRLDVLAQRVKYLDLMLTAAVEEIERAWVPVEAPDAPAGHRWRRPSP